MPIATIEDGGILTPAGFSAGAAACGIKSEPGALDVGLLLADGPCSAAGVFTRNAFAAASVQWDRERLPSGDIRAVIVNSGNANSCTGAQGEADVVTTADLTADLAGCRREQVCTASTGIIGHLLPMDKLAAGVRDAHAALGSDAEAARRFERAIMTTDTRPKAAAVRSEVGGTAFHVGGACKGSGMIAPNMATMLAFVTTDAAVAPEMLEGLLQASADRTFNRITVDGDSSTNDMVLALASGASGVSVDGPGPAADAFAEALEAVMLSLATQIVRDGEGATKLIEVAVSGAADAADAETAARAVAESQLFKCAVYGSDPNWGRIVCAIGYSGARVDPAATSVRIGGVCVFRGGVPTGEDAADEMAGDTVAVRIELGLGDGAATVRTCDLSHEYVTINAEYHT